LETAHSESSTLLCTASIMMITNSLRATMRQQVEESGLLQVLPTIMTAASSTLTAATKQHDSTRAATANCDPAAAAGPEHLAAEACPLTKVRLQRARTLL
jgi:hypothetical protein